MNKKIIIIGIAVILLSINARVQAQEGSSNESSINYIVRLGMVIGGTSPIPLPVELRKINSYSPKFGLNIEGDVYKFFDEHWGCMVGLRGWTTGMETDARVKSYSMEIVKTNLVNGQTVKDKLSGYYTGNVKTEVSCTYITLPLLAAYRTGNWTLKMGPYFSYVIDHTFEGEVYNGYLREGDPTGDKILFDDDNTGTYDFSEDMRRFQWGLEAGADWNFKGNWLGFVTLDWGMNNIFKSDFKTISFSLYPIYASFGLAYYL